MNIYLVLVSSLITVCFCTPASQSRPTTQYDVGCYAARERALRLHLFYRHVNVPSCQEGGLWRHYQCKLGSPCYCVYVDTGNSFPVYAPRSPIYYRFFYFAHFAEKACPVRKQRETSPNDCRNPPLSYPCRLSETKYVFNTETQACEETTGCYGYSNRSECETRCGVQVYGSCNFPLDEGEFCERRLIGTRYRHDQTTGECQSFTYRGCGGNSNNYENIWDCQQACVPQVNVSAVVRVDERITYSLIVPQWVADRFQLSLNETTEIVGDTFAQIGEYVFDFTVIIDEDHDDSRTLNLAGGINSDDTKTEEEQLREIFPSHIVCNRPSVTGPCRAYFPRWYYDADRQQCYKFVFGGCQTNGNNFETADDCTDYCQARYTPSPLELVAPPTDSTGRVIPDPLGRTTQCQKNRRGEVVCIIPDTTTRATTESSNTEADGESESSEEN